MPQHSRAKQRHVLLSYLKALRAWRLSGSTVLEGGKKSLLTFSVQNSGRLFLQVSLIQVLEAIYNALGPPGLRLSLQGTRFGEWQTDCQRIHGAKRQAKHHMLDLARNGIDGNFVEFAAPVTSWRGNSVSLARLVRLAYVFSGEDPCNRRQRRVAGRDSSLGLRSRLVVVRVEKGNKG